MRFLLALAVSGACAILHAPLLADGETTPLFESDEVLTVRIEGPVKRIASRAARSTEAEPARLIANGETHEIRLSARGLSRRKRENCSFPPLRVAFANKPEPTSLFARQGRIKLVTHCKDNDRFEQLAAREFTTYRLYNIITPQSLKVRPLRIEYVDGGKLVTERFGFFIEDIDDAARRLDGKEIDVPSIAWTGLAQPVAARYSVFQYMIGNTDWDMAVGPPGSDCCHNSKLIGSDKEARSELLPIPYDFDNAGIVGAPYAVPSEVLPIRSVRQRHYRGYCALNAQVRQIAPEFTRMRGSFNAEIQGSDYLDDSSKRSMIKYLDGFFEEVGDPGRMSAKMLKTCR